MGAVPRPEEREVDLWAQSRSKRGISGDAVNPIAQGLRYRAPPLMIPGGFWKNIPVFQAPPTRPILLVPPPRRHVWGWQKIKSRSSEAPP